MKVIDTNKEYSYYIRLSNIDRLYNFYDNLLRSLHGDYNYNSEQTKKEIVSYTAECSRLSILRRKTIDELNNFYKENLDA